jgi:hypothetical protein
MNMSAIDMSGIEVSPPPTFGPITYSPLVLQHNKPGREWTLDFCKVPEYKVTLRGVDPTRDEMVEVLSNMLWMPIAMVDICMAAAASARRVE